MSNTIPSYILKTLENRGDKTVDEVLQSFSMTPARIKDVKKMLEDNNSFGNQNRNINPTNNRQPQNDNDDQRNIEELESEEKERLASIERGRLAVERAANLERKNKEKRLDIENEQKELKERKRREEEELQQQAKIKAEMEARKAKEEAERRAAEEKARLEAEQEAKEEAERKAAEEKARHDVEQKAAEEKARLVKEHTKNKKSSQSNEVDTTQEIQNIRTIETDIDAAKNIEDIKKEELQKKAPKKLSWFQRRAIKKAIRRRKKEEEKAVREAKEFEEKARLEAERKAAEEKARLEAEQKAKEEAERRAAEEKARIEAEHQAKLEAERKAKEEAERKAAEEKARLEKEEAERQARLEAEQKAKEEAERRAKLEAERKAAEEKARIEAERKAAKEEAERRAAEKKARIEAEHQAKLEAERKAAEEKARHEAEQKAAEEKSKYNKKKNQNQNNQSKKSRESKITEINSDKNQMKINLEKEAAPQFANPFVSLFNKKIDTAFGMDISDNSIELLEFSALFNHKPRVYSRVVLNDGVIVDGVIAKKDKFQEKIKELLLEAKPGKVSTNRVILSIPETQLYTWSTNIDTSTISGKLKDKIYEESKKFIPLDYRYIYWDVISYQNQHKNNYSATFFAIEKKVLNNYVSYLNELGIDVVDFSLAAINVARVFLPINKELVSAIVEIGEEITNVSIFKGNRILKLFMTTPVGGQNINNEIIKNLKVTELEAEDMKQKFGITESNKPEYQNAVQTGLKDIISEVKKVFDFYEQDSEEKISHVFFTGGTSLLKGLDKESGNILGKKIQSLESIPLVSESNIFRDEINLKLFSNVLGLAISGVIQEKKIFSFQKQLEVKDFDMGFFKVLKTGYFSRNRMIFDFAHITYAFLIVVVLTVLIFASIIALSIDWSVVFN